MPRKSADLIFQKGVPPSEKRSLLSGSSGEYAEVKDLPRCSLHLHEGKVSNFLATDMRIGSGFSYLIITKEKNKEIPLNQNPAVP